MSLPALLDKAGYSHDMAGAVAFTGRHRNTIGQAAAKGLIPGAIKSGKQWYFKELGLLLWQGVPADESERRTA
jgi:hypothetical protein